MAVAFKLLGGGTKPASDHLFRSESRSFQINEISLSNSSLRPIVRAQVQGQAIPFLYDTGADCSVISREVFQSIPLVNRPHKLKKEFNLKSASKNALKIDGRFLMHIEVMGRRLMHPVFVCENLTQPAIMGMDMISKLGLNYDCLSRVFSVQKEPDTAVVFSLVSAEIIPPLTAVPMKVQLRGDNGRSSSMRRGIARIDSVRYPLLSGGPGIIECNNDGTSIMMIKNCSPVPVSLERGENIGVCEPLVQEPMEVKPEKLMENMIAYLAKNKRKSPTPLSGVRLKEFITDVKLNVPASERTLYSNILVENFDVFSKDKLDLGVANNFEHRITLHDTQPSYIKQFRIPEAHRDSLAGQVTEWLKLGIIEPANSRFNSPIFVVPKKDGTQRFVLDFRALNAKSHDDRYTMKDVSECIGDIGRAGSHIFSTLDLTAGFWQMPLDEKSRPYTAFTIPGLGQFQWTRGAMGLKGCPGSFQRLVELAVKGIPGIIVYIDDLLVHSSSHEEHRRLLKLLFQRLRQVGLKANLKKCEFGATNVSYLGFRLTPDGILPGIDKLKVIREAKPPTTVTEIRQFLGLCNFFRTHVKSFALISSPLSQLTCKAANWRNGILPPSARRAFETLRKALISEPVVAYPRRNRPYSLIVDASTGGEGSEGGMGAILCQTDEKGHMCVIAYASRGLQKHEKNYTPFLAEMMAAVWGMNHFDVYLRGRHFTLYSDHRPLEKLGKVHTKTLNRLQEAMNEFNFTIVYKKGSEMPADFLSRNISAIETDNVEDELMPRDEELIREQENDPYCGGVLKFLKHATVPSDPSLAKLVKSVGPHAFLQKGVLWRRMERPGHLPRNVVVLPVALAPHIIKEAHGTLLTGHGGANKTRERILEGFYWPSMEGQISEFLKQCPKCQMIRTTDRPAPGPLFPLPQCTRPNQRMHCDLFGPLKTSEQGKKYILCMTDAFTKYVEIVAVPNKEVYTVSSAIFNRWICRYGSPLEVVTDQGKEFCAELSNKLYEKLQVKHTTTTPAHPQCNAQAEVANKTIAKYLSSVVDSSTLDWELYLPPLAFSYNTSLHRTVKTTPFFLTYGVEPRIPGLKGPDGAVDYGEDPVTEWVTRLKQARDLAAQNSWAANEKYKEHHDAKADPHKFVVGQQVLVDIRNFLGKNRKLSPNWEGPYPITRIWDNGVVDVKTPRREWRLNIQRIKPFFVSSHVPADQPDEGPPPNIEPPVVDENMEEEIQIFFEHAPQPLPNLAVPPPPPGPRPRGRPRKTAAPPMPPLPLNDTIVERRLTRAQAQRMERAGLTPDIATGLVNAINCQVIDGLLKRGLTLAQINVPMQTKQQWLARRKGFLEKLNPAARNILLTGDPAFAFDPVVYEFVMSSAPHELPPLVHQQLGYLSPPATPGPSPPGTPPLSIDSDPEFLDANEWLDDEPFDYSIPEFDPQTPPPRLSPPRTPPVANFVPLQPHRSSPLTPSPHPSPEYQPRPQSHFTPPNPSPSTSPDTAPPHRPRFMPLRPSHSAPTPPRPSLPHRRRFRPLPDHPQPSTSRQPPPPPPPPPPSNRPSNRFSKKHNRFLQDTDSAAALFERLSTSEFPGGHRTRSVDPSPVQTNPPNPFRRFSQPATPAGPPCSASSPSRSPGSLVRLSPTTAGLSSANRRFLQNLRPQHPATPEQGHESDHVPTSTPRRPHRSPRFAPASQLPFHDSNSSSPE